MREQSGSCWEVQGGGDLALTTSLLLSPNWGVYRCGDPRPGTFTKDQSCAGHTTAPPTRINSPVPTSPSSPSFLPTSQRHLIPFYPHLFLHGPSIRYRLSLFTEPCCNCLYLHERTSKADCGAPSKFIMQHAC